MIAIYMQDTSQREVEASLRFLNISSHGTLDVEKILCRANFLFLFQLLEMAAYQTVLQITMGVVLSEISSNS